MKITKMKIENLKYAPYNPRKMRKAVFERLKENIRAFKVYSPLIVNVRNNQVIGGNQRLRALIELGYQEVDVVLVDLPPDREMVLNVALNKLVGEFDNPALPVIFEEIMKTPELLNLTGFELPEIFNLIDQHTVHPDDDFDLKKEILAIERPLTAPEEIVELGVHKIGCFDTAKKGNLERLLGEEKVSLLHMDLPYGCAYDSNNRPKPLGARKQESLWKAIENDNLTGVKYLGWFKEVVITVKPFLIDGAPAYFWGGFRNFGLMTQVLEEQGFCVSNVNTWVKPTACPGFGDYNFASEFLLYTWLKGKGPHLWFGPKNETNVWEVERDEASGALHPTAKPISLARRILANSSQRGDIVFDGCMGVGFNLIACQEMGRVFRGCEIEPLYVDVAVKRYIRTFGANAVSPAVKAKYFGGNENGKKQ